MFMSALRFGQNVAQYVAVGIGGGVVAAHSVAVLPVIAVGAAALGVVAAGAAIYDACFNSSPPATTPQIEDKRQAAKKE